MLFWIGIAIMVASGMAIKVVTQRIKDMYIRENANGLAAIIFAVGFITIIVGITT